MRAGRGAVACACAPVAIAVALAAGCGSLTNAHGTARTTARRPSTVASATMASTTTMATTTTAGATVHHAPIDVATVVALGDSVPSGAACSCTAYPVLVAAHVAVRVGHAVVARNDAHAGYVSGDVVGQLHEDAAAIRDVQHADVVLVEVGANDIERSATCGSDVGCYTPRLPTVVANLDAIVERVRALAAPRRVTIVLLDYWNVWLGGKYAAAHGAAYVRAADTLTLALRADVRSLAARRGTVYADLRVAFKGVGDDEDETALLAHDGDHPNAAGHQRIADTVDAALEPLLSA